MDARTPSDCPTVGWTPVTSPDLSPLAPARPAVARGRSSATRRTSRDTVPVTSAWRVGDPVGRRQFADLATLDLEGGGRLPVTLAYETWGELNEAGDNAVLVLHALTADSHVTGGAGDGHPTAGWWSEMVGPGRPIDTDRWFVVAPNVLGGCQGSTGPASNAPDGLPWGSRFPVVTVRDQVAAEIDLTRELGIRSWALVVGASMGGLRVLEWALMGPEAGIGVDAITVIASTAQSSADQIAWAHSQLLAIRADPKYRGGDYYEATDGDGPHVGLSIARSIAHTTYRSAPELNERFGRVPQGGEDPLHGGRYAVQSYLDHHGDKLARRFDAGTYVRLTESMLTHDLGRDRGGVETALGQITARALVVAVDSDRLFLPAESARIQRGIPDAEPLHVMHSDHGHDGFLVDFDQLGPIVAEFLGTPERVS